MNMYKVAHTAEDNYDAVVTKKWHEDFQSVPWLKMPKMEIEMPPPSLNTPRNRTVSGSSARGNSGRGDLATGMGYGGDLNALDTDEMDMGGILYQPSLHAEERQLLEALFACYGPDPRTICRLLCRPDASLEVQVSTPTLAFGYHHFRQGFALRLGGLSQWFGDLNRRDIVPLWEIALWAGYWSIGGVSAPCNTPPMSETPPMQIPRTCPNRQCPPSGLLHSTPNLIKGGEIDGQRPTAVNIPIFAPAVVSQASRQCPRAGQCSGIVECWGAQWQ